MICSYRGDLEPCNEPTAVLAFVLFPNGRVERFTACDEHAAQFSVAMIALGLWIDLYGVEAPGRVIAVVVQ